LARLYDGDIIRLDAERGLLNALVDPGELARRQPAAPPKAGNAQPDLGRHLFSLFRQSALGAEFGGGVFKI
jgi:phosphogluconate dehydratase